MILTTRSEIIIELVLPLKDKGSNKYPSQSNVHLIHAGDKVGQSEATLLQMLNVQPFAYGLVVENIYDNGAVFAPEILDITG